LSGTIRVSRYQKKHSPTHTYHGHQSSLICFIHLLRSMASSLFNLRAWQSFFPQSLSKFSLVYLLAWHPPFDTPYISSSNHCLLFAAHAHTITTCFVVVLRLYHLIPVSLSCSLTPHIHLTILSLPAKMPPHFPFLQARSHFHATCYFAHNCCTISLSLSMIYPYR